MMVIVTPFLLPSAGSKAQHREDFPIHFPVEIVFMLLFTLIQVGDIDENDSPSILFGINQELAPIPLK